MKFPDAFSSEDRLAASLMVKMAARDRKSLDVLYTLYHRQLLRLFTTILKDSFTAEEVLQDTFVRAYQRAGDYNPRKGVPFAWLVTIGRRLAIDRIRKRRARPNLVPDQREHYENSGDNAIGDVESRVHQNLEYAWIRECFQDLSDSQREILELAFLKGYTHHEIAKQIDKPLGTVKSDLRRGLMRLRKSYLEGND